VDKFNDSFITAYVTPGQVKMLMLHDTKIEEPLRAFFQDVHEAYVKVLLNPFYSYGKTIVSPTFEDKVRALALQHLKVYG
jgi:hypothetical protein